MNFITASGIRRSSWCLLLSFIALCVLVCTQAIAASGVSLTLVKSNNAPNPVPSGQVFTYTLTYSYAGAVGFSSTSPGTLIITDVVPSTLDVISATAGSVIAGNTVTFTVGGLTLPSGGGTVQINVRFKPGVTCPDTRACNVASMHVLGDKDEVKSNTDCVIATASNKWMFWKDYVSGCMVDSEDIVYRINLVNPAGNDIGGLNLSSISLTDILPPGAILTGVTGDWTGPGAGGGTVTLTGGPTSLTVMPGWAWYVAYVHVRYPSPTFSPGQNVTNNARLDFQTPCSQGQILTMTGSASNTLCDHPASAGWMSKWLNLWLYFPSNPWYTPSWSPGCCGSYSVFYYNSGAVAQSSLEFNDSLPTTVDVGTITTHVPAGMSSVTMDIYCYTGGSCGTTPTYSATYTSSSSYFAGSLPPVCHIRWRYTGTLNPGEYIYNNADVCLRSASYAAPYPAVVAGDDISNTVCVTGTSVPAGLCATTHDIVTPTAPNILAAKFFEGKAGSCMPGCAPSTAGPFYPGDVVRWRMVVANVGSATATPCTITDALPPGFSYVGNPTYYYGPIVWATDNNPACCTLSATPPTVIGGLTSPSVGATSLTWTFPTLPSNCSGAVDYLVIEFDTKADDNPTIPPDNYFNTFTFSAGNLPTPVVSNPAEVTINGYAQLQIAKDVRQKITGTLFGPSANVQPGGQAEYRIRLMNTGILTLANINLLDILPHVGDISVLPPYATRGSMYDLPITLPITAVTGYAYRYNTNPPGPSQNPSRSAFFACTTPNPVAPPVTPGVFVPAFVSTYSFQIQGSPAMLAPGGTQDFYFTGTVPTTAAVGQIACNSYGIEVKPYGSTSCIKAESTPACVTVIPPDGDACDSIWGDTQISECCTFTTHILNTLGNISQLQYNVLPVGGGTTPGGVVQSVVTSPCTPSSTIPASLPGTTSGSLFFGPPCPSPLDVQIHATSTTASGLVCVELIATIVQKDGTEIECSDTICFHCDPAPQDRCDSMMVRAYPNMNLSTRTFTIYNLKAPTSPICDVKISVTPPPPGSGLHGSNLVVDGTPQSWPYSSSAGYTQITGAHGLPANTMVQFDLGVDFGLGWIGNVVVTVDHCDGTSCTMRYGPWDASKKGTLSVGSATDVPDRATLHMNSLTFSRADAADKHIRSIAIKYSDPVTAIVAVTGATYPCDVDNAEQGNCNDIFESVHVRDRTMMIDLRRDLDDRSNQNDPIITVVYNATNAENPTAEIIYYDENGQEVGNDNVDVTGGDPPSQAISGLSGNDRIAAVMGALTAQPNPTSGRCDLGFTLPSAATVELELMDARGTRVATVISGEHLLAGQYHRSVDLGSVPSGTYLVSLRVNGVPSVLRVELTK